MASLFGKLFGRGPSAEAPSAAQADQLYAQALAAAEQRELRRAIELYDQVIALDPSRAEAHYKRANALKDSGQPDAAITGYSHAIDRKRDYSQAYCNRGVVQHAQGQCDAALASFDEAIALTPADAFSHYNRALLLQDMNRWDDAIASYDRAIASNSAFSDAQYNRSMAHLYTGALPAGFRGFESRWKHAERLRIGELRKFEQPLWLGEGSIAGLRLLIHSEQGLGDTIQFCRYAKLAHAAGATVILEAQPALLPLLESLEGVAELVARGEELPPFDCHCPLLSLPLAFGTTLDSIPAFPSYLSSDPARVAQWRSALGAQTRPRVGLVWSGNPGNTIDQRRSVALAEWIPYLPADYQYFCLQTQVREADQMVLDGSDLIFSFDEESMDFASTAALCETMEVVISVDTSLAHLSGALGQRTWVMLATNPDWRWMRDRPDSPWYPSMTLYRQQTAGDWTAVFARIEADLKVALG